MLFYQETFFGAPRDVKMKALETDISLLTGPGGEPRRGSLTAVSDRQMREGSGNRASVSMGALRGEPGGRALLLRALKDT